MPAVAPGPPSGEAALGPSPRAVLLHRVVGVVLPLPQLGDCPHKPSTHRATGGNWVAGVGLDSLLLGPAWEAAGVDPEGFLAVLDLALGGDIGLVASLTMAARSASCNCQVCLLTSFTTAAAPSWTACSHRSTL